MIQIREVGSLPEYLEMHQGVFRAAIGDELPGPLLLRRRETALRMRLRSGAQTWQQSQPPANGNQG